ncbi:MAG TPA: thiamine-phosphate kinase [Methylophilus sp.]|nr:thiamine-phosphate kinase [Methylophilus sp.]HQQ33158.1 thiamine-phosphate kinase [Methylophilus sp.]
MASEFDIIRDFFTRPSKHTDLSIGDDAALIQPSPGTQLAISTDMLVAGTHFFVDAAPYDIGWKSLAVNISDMAAMGAQPKWATLSISLAENDTQWLSEFARGFFACADKFNVDLIGGDTTRGPLNISVTIIGETPIGRGLVRSGAKEGDDIWVSGHIGSAAAGLAHLQGKMALENVALHASLDALHRPMPRVALGLALRNIANSAIDISDGLAQDLGHILAASHLGAEVFYESIPKNPALKAKLDAVFETMVLSGGDDYELCFTAPQQARDAIRNIGQELNLQLSRIGIIRAGNGLTVYDAENKAMSLQKTGYDHFKK